MRGPESAGTRLFHLTSAWTKVMYAGQINIITQCGWNSRRSVIHRGKVHYKAGLLHDLALGLNLHKLDQLWAWSGQETRQRRDWAAGSATPQKRERVEGGLAAIFLLPSAANQVHKAAIPVICNKRGRRVTDLKFQVCRPCNKNRHGPSPFLYLAFH